MSERTKFHDSFHTGFDPTMFVQSEEATWTDESGWRDARLRYWYRNFYRDTPTGQLMVLRSDEPNLYHYPEGRQTRQSYATRSDGESQAHEPEQAGDIGHLAKELMKVQRQLGTLQSAVWVLVGLVVVWLLFIRR